MDIMRAVKKPISMQQLTFYLFVLNSQVKSTYQKVYIFKLLDIDALTKV